LFDADKLDSFGAVGIVRNLLFYYSKRSVDYILENLEVKWQGLSLNETRAYARKDYDYIRNFFMHLEQALSG
jgi:hypothetical protein